MYTTATNQEKTSKATSFTVNSLKTIEEANEVKIVKTSNAATSYKSFSSSYSRRYNVDNNEGGYNGL